MRFEKKITLAMVVALTAITIVGCSEKKKSDDIIASKVVKKAPAAPIYMQEYTQTKSVTLGSAVLNINIVRQPDDSLAMVKDETGQKFVDNRIHLTIIDDKGKAVVDKSFTKATFDAYLDDDYRQTGILEGLVFDKVDGGRICLAASVSHPQTDEYIPLVVKISRSGDIAISQDTRLDTSAEEEGDV